MNFLPRADAIAAAVAFLVAETAASVTYQYDAGFVHVMRTASGFFAVESDSDGLMIGDAGEWVDAPKPQPAKSQGHVAFLGTFEYFIGPAGSLHRAPIANPLMGEYRGGARWEAPAHMVEERLELARRAFAA